MPEQVFFVLSAAVVGLCVGSFLNVVIHRLPKMMERDWRADCAELAGQDIPKETPYNLVVPRSQCPSCGHQITASENIPVLSWLALGGKCSVCQAPITIRYPVVEMLGALLAVYAIVHFGATAKGFAACGLLWTLLALTCIDFDTQLLPDGMTVPLMGRLDRQSLGFVRPARHRGDRRRSRYLRCGPSIGLFKLIRGKEGMGYGDFKLLAALGAWLGWQMLPLIVLLSSVVGAVIGLSLIAFKGRDHNVPLAFGPISPSLARSRCSGGPRSSKCFSRLTWRSWSVSPAESAAANRWCPMASRLLASKSRTPTPSLTR